MTGFSPKSVFVSAVPVKLNINTNKTVVFVLFRSCLRFHGLHSLQLYTVSNLSESRKFRLFLHPGLCHGLTETLTHTDMRRNSNPITAAKQTIQSLDYSDGTLTQRLIIFSITDALSKYWHHSRPHQASTHTP